MRVRLKLLSFIVAASFSIPSRAESLSLPESFSVSTLSRQGFVAYPMDPDSPMSPLGSRIRLNGSEPCDRNCQEEIFRDEHLAWIPPGTSIAVDRGAEGRERWEYPVGTQVAHPIWFRSGSGQSIFELRLVLKAAPGVWLFGVYAPPTDDPRSQSLLRRHQEGSVPFERELNQEGLGVVTLKLNSVPLGSCQTCHFTTSHSAYQYSSRLEMGPCGFGPGRPGLRALWRERYRQAHGRDPFVER